MLLEIKGRELELVERVSAERKITLEDAVRAVFEKGLGFFERRKKYVHSDEFREKQERVKEFIENNWEKMTDREMSDALGFFVRTIRERRLALGLKRYRGVKAAIDRDWLEKALNEEGFLPAEIARKMGVSKERISQICEEFNPPIEIKRSPLWYASRLGIPQFAEREWLESKLKEARGADNLSIKLKTQELEISPYILVAQARRLNIPEEVIFNIYRVEVVKKRCSYCRRVNYRKKTTIRKNQKSFFCNKLCNGRFFAKNFGFKKRKKRKTRP